VALGPLADFSATRYFEAKVMRSQKAWWVLLPFLALGPPSISDAQERKPLPNPTTAARSAVLEFVAGEAESACKTSTTDQCKTIRERHSQYFFSGFINVSGMPLGALDWSAIAYTSGQRYRRAHSDELIQIMTDFGYVPVTAIEGRWVTGFETSRFNPAEHSDQSWWVSILDAAFRYLPDARAFAPPAGAGWTRGGVRDLRVRISGFLNRACADRDAPGQHEQLPHIPGSGGFGHMGLYDCQIYATTIENLQVGP
jgi:hypothetical protein